MTDSADVDKQPLTWPTLFGPEELDEPIVEHIHIKTDQESIDELLFEIELNHSHVADKLRLLLGYPEFEIEIQNLIVNNKRLDRQGFSKNVLDCLLKLFHLHVEKYVMMTEVKQDTWELNHLI